MGNQAREVIYRLFSRQRRTRIMEIACFALSISVIISSVVYALVSHLPGALITGFLVFVVIAFLLGRYYRSKLTPYKLAQYLNQHFPQLQHSAEIILTEPDQLTPLLQLQQQKISSRLNDLTGNIRLPHLIPQALGSLVVSAILFILVVRFSATYLNTNSPLPEEQVLFTNSSGEETQFTVASTKLYITPPKYTGLDPYFTTDLNQEIPEDATLTFEFSTNLPAATAYLELINQQRIPLNPKTETTYSTKFNISQNTLYSFHFQYNDSSWFHSDLYQLMVIPDAAPIITLKGIPSYMILPYKEKQLIDLNIIANDDYGISKANMVMVISQGDGEQVKFHTETRALEVKGNKSLDQKITLPLPMNHLNPGDELYLHAEIWDNATPNPQKGKSSTFLIEIEDTTQAEFAIDMGMGVDRIPEYFRSQRQIIIDTEQLIAERKELDEEIFQKRSNNIGIDQKLIRLRYGKFLGEEFERGSGGDVGRSPSPVHTHGSEDHEADSHGSGSHEADSHSNEDHEQHDHDPAEHSEHDHDHSPSGSESSLETLMESYVHFHDMTEELTYFDESVRTKLKAALSLMWDAELQLRTFHPEEALPYEYQALKLIKEIQQQSRVYVSRVGLDLPPLKPEKRLTGELDEVENLTLTQKLQPDEHIQILRKAVSVIQSLKSPEITESRHRKSLEGAAQILASESLETPLGYLPALSMISGLINGEIPPQEWEAASQQIIQGLMKALPIQKGYPPSRNPSLDQLQQAYLNRLTQ